MSPWVPKCRAGGSYPLQLYISFPGNAIVTAQIYCLRLCGRHLVLGDGYRDMNHYTWNHPINVPEVIWMNNILVPKLATIFFSVVLFVCATPPSAFRESYSWFPILPDHSWCVRKQIQLGSKEDRKCRLKKIKGGLFPIWQLSKQDWSNFLIEEKLATSL